MAKEPTKQYLRSYDVNEKLIASIDNGIIILDNELKIHHFNKWLELHTHLKESNLINKHLDKIFENINIKTLKRKINTALRMGTPTFYTASISKYLIPIKINKINISDFKYMQQDVCVIPFDKVNNLVALIITDQTNITNTNNLLNINIQKVKELNKELIKERETIDERVLLLKINKKSLITYASHAYLKLIDFTKEELLKNNFFLVEKIYIKEKLKKEILLHMKEEKVFKFEERVLGKEDKELWMKNTLVPEYDAAGKHVGFILFRDNITDSKELHIYQEKLLINSRSAAMGEMIGMIAHQWRQPLSIINTIISTLRVKKELNILDEEGENTSFKKIEDTVQYLSTTIDDFRNFFKKNKTITQIPLITIFDKSTILLKEEMKLHEIEYIEEIDKELNIRTYQNELIQSVINIIKNSVDAFKDNKCNHKIIHAKATKETTHIRISILDNAGGINKEIIKKVFEPYFSTKSKNGTGLGLYMCKTIIENHLNGKLMIVSNQEITEVIIELPYEILKIEEI